MKQTLGHPTYQGTSIALQRIDDNGKLLSSKLKKPFRLGPRRNGRDADHVMDHRHPASRSPGRHPRSHFLCEYCLILMVNVN